MNINPVLLFVIFIFKIILILSLPVYIIFKKEKNKKTSNILIIINLVFFSLFIVLKIFNNPYIVNSSILGVKNLINKSKYTDKTVSLSNDPNIVEEIVTDKIYKTKSGSNVYYFNSNISPLRDKKVNCENNYVYFKNVGNNITSIATLLSSELNKNIDPLEILKLSIKNDIFDCDTGVDTSSLLDLISNNYNVRVREVDQKEAIAYINTGKVVFAEIDNNYSGINLSCDESNIVIYNLNKEGGFNILIPDERDYDYICPDNTKGYGTIIKANTNESSWAASDITSLVTRYIILER